MLMNILKLIWNLLFNSKPKAKSEEILDNTQKLSNALKMEMLKKYVKQGKKEDKPK